MDINLNIEEDQISRLIYDFCKYDYYFVFEFFINNNFDFDINFKRKKKY